MGAAAAEGYQDCVRGGLDFGPHHGTVEVHHQHQGNIAGELVDFQYEVQVRLVADGAGLAEVRAVFLYIIVLGAVDALEGFQRDLAADGLEADVHVIGGVRTILQGTGNVLVVSGYLHVFVIAGGGSVALGAGDAYDHQIGLRDVLGGSADYVPGQIGVSFTAGRSNCVSDHVEVLRGHGNIH